MCPNLHIMCFTLLETDSKQSRTLPKQMGPDPHLLGVQISAPPQKYLNQTDYKNNSKYSHG